MPILRLLATLFLAQLPALWALNPTVPTTSWPAHELEAEAVSRQPSKMGELPELTSPHPMLIDNGRLIVLDDYQVHV